MGLSNSVLLDAVAATGAGSVVNTPTPNGPASNYAVTVQYLTAAPTLATVKLQGSIDGSTWVDMGETSDVSATSVGFAVADMPFSQVRGNLTAYTAGGSNTGVTVRATGR